jgi:hypothetical protein
MFSVIPIHVSGRISPVARRIGVNTAADDLGPCMAARELGIEYPRIEYEGDDPLGFVISHNLTRRHFRQGLRFGSRHDTCSCDRHDRHRHPRLLLIAERLGKSLWPI